MAMLLFHPQTREGGYATYATVHEELISHVEQTYGEDSENILKSIEQNAYLTFPEPTPKMIPVPSPAKAGDPITDIQNLEYDAELRMETVRVTLRSPNMVFTLRPFGHTLALWQRAKALVESSVVQASFASFRAVS